MLALVLSAALSAPAAPVPVAPPTDASAAAPRILDLKPEPDGKIWVMVVRTEKVKQVVGQTNAIPPTPITQEYEVRKQVRVELADVKDLVVTTADGKAVDTKDALKKLADGGAVIASADGKKVDPRFLKLLRDDALILVSPDFAGIGSTTGRVGRPIVKPLPAPLPGPQPVID